MGCDQLWSLKGDVLGLARGVASTRVGGLLSFLHQRIVAQRLMVVEVLVAESDGEYPLPHQRRHRMFDVGMGSPIDQA